MKSNKIAISPQCEVSLSLLIGLDTHKVKLFFKSLFPKVDIDLSIIKNNSIASGPADPTCRYKDFSEDGTSKSCSSVNYHVQMG